MNQTSFTFGGIGTTWYITINEILSDERKAEVLKRIEDRIEVFDKNYSRFRDDSLIMEMSRRAGEYRLPEDAKNLLDIYEKCYRVTNGAMTPLIGQVLVDAGYDAEYSLVPKQMTEPKSWDEVLNYHYPTLVVKEPTLLDFGAAGKGYLIDIVAGILKDEGYNSFLVNAGGDIAHVDGGSGEATIGLERPDKTDEMVGIAKIHNQSICGSAGNRRAWANFHHIINPFTLNSPKEIASVWVVAADTVTADALTTCLFFMPAAEIQKAFTFEYAILFSDHTIEKSAQFPGEFFTE